MLAAVEAWVVLADGALRRFLASTRTSQVVKATPTQQAHGSCAASMGRISAARWHLLQAALNGGSEGPLMFPEVAAGGMAHVTP